MPLGPKGGKSGLKRLQQIYQKLPVPKQETLLEFAEFLVSRPPEQKKALPKPVPHERPQDESVVKAIRRLSATYPMLDKSKMLNETSALVAQHIMHGREAKEVIDEIEAIFEKHYQRLAAEFLEGSSS